MARLQQHRALHRRLLEHVSRENTLQRERHERVKGEPICQQHINGVLNEKALSVALGNEVLQIIFAEFDSAIRVRNESSGLQLAQS
eukprot:CAMPEP_0195655218 /NCGR_PEP_ID=MMETSP0815-20121206/34342_1 /TAXON_ID=97485 /ORGANISM="Prymnesium parvum, Strain Texoma1" /LENGTH=85 /DNA_ID=CAMNT_0040799493 /DNA_START=75 /DNA_END=333 /DNA_ORIENTATION=-